MHTPQENGNHHFLLGLMTGSVIGAGLAIWFAPRLASELRQRVTESATDFGNAASRRYQDVTARVNDVADRVTDAVDTATTRAQAVRDDAADAVVRGARAVEQFAKASKS